MNKDILWQTKLAARIHDPAEKALVLLRDPAGHEGGSIVAIGRALGFETQTVVRRDGTPAEKLSLPPEMKECVEQADRWAAAADRVQFPKDENKRFVPWAQVRFTEKGELVHPLSGHRYEVRGIGQNVLATHIKVASEELFKTLIHSAPDGSPDHRLSALAFWRFGPELGCELEGVGHLWRLLPADTRTPDHTIWQHLDLVSALAGATAGGGRPALLTVSIGPVQDFIAAGRSTSDLWAGSHFLSMLAWQAMKVVAEAYGPDAVLFPQLRGVPVVDLWLIEQGLARKLFATGCDWNDNQTDYNPLFAAALPNKFVALVPESEGASLAPNIASAVRAWVQETGKAMLDRVLKEIGEEPNGQHCYQQLHEQLRDFPEVHWSLVPWLPPDEIESALAPFYPADGKRPGLFGNNAWRILNAPIEPQQGWRFWEPNDGVLYPAIHDAGERLLAAAKATRVFRQKEQKGYRDSLTGEYEWLTLDEKQLTQGSPRTRSDTLWARAAQKKPSWAKKGEHLSAFGLIKRLWPAHYLEWLKARGIDAKLSRYVVSTHVMALAPSLERLMTEGPADDEAFRTLVDQTESLERAVLPRRLMRREFRMDEQRWNTAAKLPLLIEDARERADDANEEKRVEAVIRTIENAIGAQAEKYYGLILMDGDRLGSWLSGEHAITFGQVFHSEVLAGLEGYRDDRLKAYLASPRLPSPAQHMAISSALNGFALDLVRHVVEDLCLGKLLYAGGDDVMAMVAVRDLPKASWLLRIAYSGGMPDERNADLFEHDLDLHRGFVQWNKRLYRVMGECATASCGAVVAHHQAPLSAVLRELRETEKRAKNHRRLGKDSKPSDRDAFCITVIKRSGGVLRLAAEWGEPLALLVKFRDFLAEPRVSRRAVYNSLVWLKDLPEDADVGMLGSLLTYQLARQAASKTVKDFDLPGLSHRLAHLACRQSDRRDWLRHFLGVAEFLARETRCLNNPSTASSKENIA